MENQVHEIGEDFGLRKPEHGESLSKLFVVYYPPEFSCSFLAGNNLQKPFSCPLKNLVRCAVLQQP